MHVGLGWLEPALEALRIRYFTGSGRSNRWDPDQWSRAVAAAITERLGPALADALGSRKVDVPREAWAALTATRLENERQLAAQSEILRTLWPRFEAERIRPVVFKGLALSRHYPVSGVREASDIDLLVPENAVAAAVAVLTKSGFSRWSGGGRSAAEYALCYVGRSGRRSVAVDLHPGWHEVRLSENGRSVRIAGRVEPLHTYEVAGAPYAVLPPELELYVVGAHAVLHGFRTLSIYLDAATIARTMDRRTLERLNDLARSTGRGRHLRHVLSTVADLFGVSVPPECLSLPRRLGVPVAARLGYPGDGYRLLPSSMVMELVLRRGLRRKLQFVWWLLGHTGRANDGETGQKRRGLWKLARGLRWFKGTKLDYRAIESIPLRP